MSDTMKADHRYSTVLANTTTALREARAENERLRAAIKEDVARCQNCGGTGVAYTHEDETQVGCVPGSSATDCVDCADLRAALASPHEQKSDAK